MADRFDLQRFWEAQDPIFDRVLSELRRGRKQTHWMWFVFPQIEGLGSSPTARRFAISSRAEAEAYLQHPVLGPRLCECTQLVNQHESLTIAQIFGSPDDLKFHSSMTLFAQVSSDAIFQVALQKHFAGEPDRLTLARL